MELILIELMLWAGLAFFFWVMKNQLSQIETEIEKMGIPPSASLSISAEPLYEIPERLFEEIGRYRDSPIHRLALIGGRFYRFDYICHDAKTSNLRPDQRCLKPGLVYTQSYETPAVFTEVK